MQHGRMRHLPHATLGLSVGDNGSVSKCETNAPAATVVHECVQDAHVACHRAKTLSVSLSLAAWSAACGPRSVEARVVFQLTKLPHAACGLPFVVASCHFLLPLPLLALKLNCFHLPAKKDDNWRSLTSAQHTHTHAVANTHTPAEVASLAACCVCWPRHPRLLLA